MAVKKRQWLMNSLPVRCPPDIVVLHKHLQGFYQFDKPLVKRLYDHVDFKRTHPVENILYRLYVSAGCLRWLFRANQLHFARMEAKEYISLSYTVSQGHTQDALSVMDDVLSRLRSQLLVAREKDSLARSKAF